MNWLQTMSRNDYKQHGFSLIELMIAVAIVGILAAIAYPSYAKYRLKATRSAAIDCVVEAQRRIENVFVRTNSYPSDLSDSKLGYGSATPSCGDRSEYQLSMTAPTVAAPNAYQVTAIAQGAQAKDGDIQLAYNASQLNPGLRLQRQHRTPGGTNWVTTDGWAFQPGQ